MNGLFTREEARALSDAEFVFYSECGLIELDAYPDRHAATCARLRESIYELEEEVDELREDNRNTANAWEAANQQLEKLGQPRVELGED